MILAEDFIQFWCGKTTVVKLTQQARREKSRKHEKVFFETEIYWVCFGNVWHTCTCYT